MKKFILVVVLAVSLGGCEQLSMILDAVPKVTASVNNPVTKDMLNTVENGAIVVFAGLKAYKKACVELAVPQSCRGTIEKIKVYTKKLEIILPQLRAFVKDNDQVNAVMAYNAIVGLIADLKTEAGRANIQIGAK